VLPSVSVKGLASKILSLAARQLPQDWKPGRLYQKNGAAMDIIYW